MGEYADAELDYYATRNYGVSIYGYNDKRANITRKRDHNNMADFTTVFVKGELFWAKIVGKPVPNYEKDGREWTVDFVPEDTSFLKEHGLLDRLKEAREPITGNFLRLKKPELDSEGNKNEPIKIVDANNQPWDGSKIGNGSRVDVKLTIADWGRGKKKSIWIKVIRVTEHIPFEVDEFAGMGEPAANKAKAAPKKAAKPLAELDDISDEISF